MSSYNRLSSEELREIKAQATEMGLGGELDLVAARSLARLKQLSPDEAVALAKEGDALRKARLEKSRKRWVRK